MKNFIKNFNFVTLQDIFFRNTGTKQTIAKNTFWLGLSELSINLLKFALFIYAAKVLGDVGFGQFAFVSSFVAIFGIFFDFGLSEALTREFAKEVRNEQDTATLFSLQVFISVLVGALLSIASFFVSTKVGNVQSAVLIMGGYMFIANLQTFFYAVFRARQKMQLEFFPNFLQNLAITGFGFLLLYKLQTVTSLSLAYFLGVLLAFGPTMLYFHRNVAPLRLHFDKKLWTKFLRISCPLALVGIVSMAIYNNIDSIMLGFFGQIKENGWYSAAYRIVTFSILPMVFVYQSFFPALATAFNQSKEKMQQLWETQLQIFIFLGLPIFFGGYALADSLISFLYPKEFHPSVSIFKILIFITFFIYLYMPFKQILVIFNQQNKIFWLFFFGMLINIGLNLFTIPHFSLYGAAISTLVAQLFVFIGLMYLSAKKTHMRAITPRVVGVFCCSLIASIMMFSVLNLMNSTVNVFLLVGMGVIVYLVVFFIVYLITVKRPFLKKYYESKK